jgi:hypothetical protein
VQPGTTTVNIAAGAAAFPAANATGTLLCSSDAVETLELPPAVDTERTDVVIVYPRGVDIGGDPAQSNFVFAYLPGQPGQPPPTVPAGQLALVQVHRPAGSAAIVAADIIDVRPGGLSIGATGGPSWPPVAPATPFTSYTDGNGEIWVARGGVNGGAWKRARDVLKAAYYRSNAWNASGAATAIAMNAIETDDYGLYNAATATFTAPLAGWYWHFATLAVTTAVATGQYMSGQLASAAGVAYAADLAWASAIGQVYMRVQMLRLMAAGDTVQVRQASGPAGLAGVTGQHMRYDIEYRGSRI